MRRFQRPRFWPTLGAWFFATLAVLACRYSVRDTGFVDLGSSTYRLVLDIPAGVATPIPPAFSVTATRAPHATAALPRTAAIPRA